jgi:hypothetical protein
MELIFWLAGSPKTSNEFKLHLVRFGEFGFRDTKFNLLWNSSGRIQDTKY